MDRQQICANCEWFTPPAPVGRRYGSCAMATSHEEEALNPSSAAVAWDSEGYHAGLMVMPTFGCNHSSGRLNGKKKTERLDAARVEGSI